MQRQKDTYVHIRISNEIKQKYMEAAEKAGMSYSDWIRYQLNKAAGI